MSNETTDISSEIEKIAKRGASGETCARKFRFPDFTIFLWGWFFISLILLMVIAWNYLQNSVYDQGAHRGAKYRLPRFIPI